MIFELKQLAEKIIPRKYLRVAGMYALRATSPIYTGNKVTCPCCKKSFSRFLPYGLKKRPNALCPWCLSLERHRGLWLFLHEKSSIFEQNIKLLHFAPEHQFQELFKASPNIDYTSADLDMPTAMLKMDITNITLPDNTFDVIICNHVLEHIPDDHKALTELFRVLKPGGFAILQTPVNESSLLTTEDITITDPKERERRFGQNDHVRIYGMDKKQRMEKAGFIVELNNYLYDMKEELVLRYGIMREFIWIGHKSKL